MATILVIDDHAINRKLLVALLSADGHLTLEASDGMEGLRVARAHRPQLIISDILMPTMDGYGLVRSLRADPALRTTPVIFYTAHYHEREARKLALACGVDRVLTKPCPTAELLKAVEQVMAGVCESDPDPVPVNFDREHLRLITTKLTENTTAFASYVAQFEEVIKLSAGLRHCQDPHALLSQVSSGARNLFGAAYSVLAIADKNCVGGVFFATSGISLDAVNGTPPALDGGLFGSLLRTGAPWRVRSMDGKALNAGLPGDYPAAQALIAVPLMMPDQAVGWLCLADKVGADEFNRHDETLLVSLAAMASQSYENLNLRLSLERQNENV
jgi:CheY-like chemotaxis protein